MPDSGDIMVMDQGLLSDDMGRLSSPTARIGVYLGGLFIPFDEKKPYIVTTKWDGLRVTEISTKSIVNWKGITKTYGTLKARFMKAVCGESNGNMDK